MTSKLGKTLEGTASKTEDEGRNPYGECEVGHQYFRGGCPSCAADMVNQYL